MDNVLLIAMTEAHGAADEADTLEAKVRAAMLCTKDHWLITNEDGRFRAAVGGAMLSADEDDKRRLEAEMRVLNALSSAMGGGGSLDLAVMDIPENPIGLMKMWKEIKGSNAI